MPLPTLDPLVVPALTLHSRPAQDSASGEATLAPTGEDGSPADAAPQAGGASWLPFILIGVLFWLILIRPQAKEQKRRRALLEALKKGDRVMTTGGMYGTIAAIDGDLVSVEVAKGVRIDFNRAAIQGLEGEGKAAEAPAQG